MKTKRHILTLVLLMVVTTIGYGQTTRYVKQSGAGAGNSWANASGDLQAVINISSAGDIIFVAKGTYKPNRPANNLRTIDANNRDNAFVLKDGVKIYGGFAGTETTLADRNLSLTANASILSGDIDNNDTVTNGISTTMAGNNAYHVVISVSDNNATVLDGFTITGGNANAYSTINVEARIITKSIGGGMYNYRSSSPSITNTTFSGNTAGFGGGMYNYSSSSPRITNTTFSENTARTGGAIRNYYSSSPKIYNSIFWGNKKRGNTSVTGADIENYNSSSPTVKYCLTQVYGANGTDGNKVGTGTSNDPKFVDATNGDFSLQLGSPAINAGTNTITGFTMPTTDANGYARIYNTTVDMGAYEYQLNPNTSILYVKKGGAGTQNGSSWANAVGELADALKWAKAQPTSVTNNLKIFVAGGTYKPLYRADNMSGANANDRDNAFVLVNGVKLYGGFAGTETTLADRNLSLTANASILSGDFNDDDNITGSGSTLSINNNGENAYHVVISVSDNNATVLDGFTITGGNANAYSTINVEVRIIAKSIGGGMLNYSSDPSITNITFSGNKANFGGGMYNSFSSSPRITNTTFSGNAATSDSGGGMCNSSSSPSIMNTTFSGNTARYGGGMSSYSSSPSITNSTFSGNKASSNYYGGGGMYNKSSSPKIYNSIFWDNKKGSGASASATVAGADIENAGGTPTVKHSLLQLIGKLH